MNGVSNELENLAYDYGIHKTPQCTFIVKKIEKYPQRKTYEFMKRIFDFFFALIAFIILFIPMVLISLLIMIDSPGNPIFKQERLGKNEKPFTIYKFRSMSIDAEADGPKWADEDDPRCTRIGRILRKTRIDELPQLINILKGDMSFVGPRPERPEFYDIFDTYIDGFRQRMMVIPGLTGWAQINGGYDLKPEEKIIFDMQYIERRSIRLDLLCILRTVRVIFKRDGAR